MFLVHVHLLKNKMCFCREEIQRIKANNPDISHREAFSTAAKNVSGLPNIIAKLIRKLLRNYIILYYINFLFFWGIDHLYILFDQWAHFPHIHFGLMLETNNQTKVDDVSI
jgi:hypothetical protein